jgi:hypothetical protein
VKLSLGGLKSLLESNVVEIKFARRMKLINKPDTRRMLATLDRDILNSKLGRDILNFKQPTQSAAYNAASKGLLAVWDIFLQDWRMIPVSNCEVVSVVPSRPPEKFWEYFNKTIGNMDATQKAAFMDK